MVPSMLSQVNATLEGSNASAAIASSANTSTTTATSNESNKNLLSDNDKVQDDLACKLRNLIANFCDEHFVKYLKDNSSKLPKPATPLPSDPKETLSIDAKEPKADSDCTKSKNQAHDETEKMEEDNKNEIETTKAVKETEEEVSMTKISDKDDLPVVVLPNKESVDSDLNLTSSSSLTPPRSSYSSTSSDSSSPSSDINGHHQNEETTKSTDSESNELTTTTTSASAIKPDTENSILDKSNDTIMKNCSSNTYLNEVVDKLDIIDHASKSIKQISSCAELNQQRLHHMDIKTPEDDPSLLSSTAALEKLWSQILIGADKLEIFGSIHVRSNNVRLFSCLIDEQLHIDNQSFSSASSCVSQDSCSFPTKLNTSMLKSHGHRAAKLRAKNLYKYERQMAQHTNIAQMYRKKMQNEMRSQQHARYDADFYEMDSYYQQKQLQKQAKLAKKVEELAKVKELNVNEMDYPMKKFKAYHSFKKNNDKMQQEVGMNQNVTEVTSLSNLATVAAAAMRLNSEVTTPPVKKSRKSSITTSVKPMPVVPQNNKDLDTTELEIDEEDDMNNSLIIDQANSATAKAGNKLNDFYGLYDEEEDFEDTSSVLSGSSFVSDTEANLNGGIVGNGNHRKHRRHRSAHSHCSSMLSEDENGHLSRSISVNDDVNNKRNSVSPALSIADSSSFDYDDEQVYQSYCSTSSFKSDFEDDYGSGSLESGKKKKPSRKSRAVDGDDEVIMVEKSMMIDENRNSNVAMNESGRHYHRRKQHLIEAEMKRQQEQAAERVDNGSVIVEKMQFKTEKDQNQVQQTQLKLQQLPKLLGLQQQQHAELQQQQEEARKNRSDTDDYLARKYKYNRRFTPYNNTTTNANQQGSVASSQQQNAFNPSEETAASNNLYLLASSRHHHRLHSTADPATNPPNSSSKLMSVNSLVDRLSPISDPDMERNSQSANGRRTVDDQHKLHHHIHHNGSHHHNNPNEIHILNRINNLSPSSSSSSSNSSSNKNNVTGASQNGHVGGNNANQINKLFHQQAQAAVALAAGNPERSSSLGGHHAQSVAALLANMHHNDPQHQASSQEVAKALAASLNPHHHLNSHNHHTQQIINRFSSNPTQSELMAAVLAQQQQHNRSLMGEAGGQFGLGHPNGPLYSRYSSHINAAVAAAAAAAASQSAHTANGRRAHSVESDAHTPSPPAITPANANGGSNGSGSSSLSSSSSSSSSTTSENYHSSKYGMHDRSDEMCKKERSSSVTSHSNDQNGGGSEKVRLVPGYDVYISTNDLNACNDDRGSATRLLRNLMDVFFDKSTLAKSSINGTGRITNTLDKHVISALFAYVKNRYQDVPHSQLTRAATDKCVQTRRNFRKKIKAAQSYFGMFPSIMIQRPPVPQGSD